MKRYKNIVFAIFIALTLAVSVIAPRIAFADSNEISALAVDKYTREPIEGVHVVIYQGGSTIVAEGETGADGYFRGRVPKSGVSKHFRCLKEVRLFPKI